MGLQITLEAARVACSYSIESAAKHFEIPVDELIYYEDNPAMVPVFLLRKIRSLYKIPLALFRIEK